MSPLIYLATIALFALVGTNQCDCELDAQRYLRTSSLFSQHEIEWVATQVRAHGGATAIQSVEYVKELTDLVGRAVRNEISIESAGIVGYTQGDLHQIWMTLDAFENLSTDCQSFQVNLFTQAVNVLYGDIETFVLLVTTSGLSDDSMLSYLAHVGLGHTTTCLDMAMQSFYEVKQRLARKGVQAEEVFDDMIGASLPGMSEDMLAAGAARLDFESGEINAESMLSSIHRYLPDADHRTRSNPAMRLFNFLRHNCAQIKQLGAVLDEYNLARALVPNRAANMPITSNFVKVNEYWRICQQLTQLGQISSSEVVSNGGEGQKMEESKSKKKWYKKLG